MDVSEIGAHPRFLAMAGGIYGKASNSWDPGPTSFSVQIYTLWLFNIAMV